MQRREQERVERLKREERIRQENLERERQEVERKQKEAYLEENERIMKTKEYELTYSILEEVQKAYIKKEDKKGKKHAKKRAPLDDTKILNEILPEAFAVAEPSPSTARLKIAPHITDVQSPQSTKNPIATGT